MSWSYRNRGSVQRIHITKKIQKNILTKKNARRDHRLQQPALLVPVRERDVPAAEEERRHHRRHRDDVGVLGDHEERELHRAVFGVIAGHQLRFRLGQVERQPVRLGEAGDQEDEERQEERQDEPEPLLLPRDDRR